MNVTVFCVYLQKKLMDITDSLSSPVSESSILPIFSARQYNVCYIALYAISRPSVCPSHGWISQRRL